MFGNDRTQMRQMFIDSWSKAQSGQPLSALERQIVAVIRQHPEYQALLKDPQAILDRDFSPDGGETNPFLHMGMHIGIQEQIATNRPAGISDLHRQLSLRSGDPHQAEHQIMECLGLTLWEAQRAGRDPDEQKYLECIRNLVK